MMLRISRAVHRTARCIDHLGKRSGELAAVLGADIASAVAGGSTTEQLVPDCSCTLAERGRNGGKMDAWEERAGRHGDENSTRNASDGTSNTAGPARSSDPNEARMRAIRGSMRPCMSLERWQRPHMRPNVGVAYVDGHPASPQASLQPQRNGSPQVVNVQHQVVAKTVARPCLGHWARDAWGDG